MTPWRLLDTDVLIDLLRLHPIATRWWAAAEPMPTAVPGFAAFELFDGCRNTAEVRQAEVFLRQFPLVWPSQSDQERALALFKPLRLSVGLSIEDALIAATVLGRDATLCTLNVRHFRAVPDLRWEQPYAKP